MRAAPIVLLLCAACTPPSVLNAPLAFAQPSASTLEGSIKRTTFVGPGHVCGHGFALDLKEDESLDRFDRQMDFLTYQLREEERSIILYEGNAPQTADRLIKTGKRFPSFIALHEAGGDMNFSASEIADRIIIGSKRDSICADQPMG